VLKGSNTQKTTDSGICSDRKFGWNNLRLSYWICFRTIFVPCLWFIGEMAEKWCIPLCEILGIAQLSLWISYAWLKGKCLWCFKTWIEITWRKGCFFFNQVIFSFNKVCFCVRYYFLGLLKFLLVRLCRLHFQHLILNLWTLVVSALWRWFWKHQFHCQPRKETKEYRLVMIINL
jgi:hypothetical protein